MISTAIFQSVMCCSVLHNPKPCRNSIEYAPNAFRIKKKNLPITFLDPVFDYRFRSNLFRRSQVAKVGQVFIHVTKRETVSVVSYSRDILFRLGQFFNEGFLHDNLVLPTKLRLIVDLNSKEGKYGVITIYILDCTNYKDWMRRAVQRCEIARTENLLSNIFCEAHALDEEAIMPRKIPFIYHQLVRWQDLEIQLAFTKQCKQGIAWIFQDSERSTNFDDNHKALMHGLHRPGKQSIDSILNLISPNSTVFGLRGNSHYMLDVIGVQEFPSFTTLLHVGSMTDCGGYIGEHASFRFITCTSVKTPTWMSLAGLTNSFEPWLWLAIITVSMLTGIILYILQRIEKTVQFSLQNVKKEHVSLSFHSITFAWNVLLCQGSILTPKFRWIGGVWLLGGLVLTNAYLGDNINTLTAPLPVRSIETFTELLQQNVTIYSSTLMNGFINFVMNRLDRMDLVGKFITNMAVPNLSTSEYFTPFNMLYVQKHFKLSFLEAYDRSKNFETWRNEQDVTHYFRHFSDPVYHENIIAECGMDAYVDTHRNLERFRSNLIRRLENNEENKGRNKHIVISEDNYGELYENWIFRSIPFPATVFLRHLHTLQETGLISKWKEEEYIRERMWNETNQFGENEKHFQAVSLSGNVHGLFLLYIGIKLVDVLTFL
ncbi:unnamed protein product [Orchesella dallaii]|uniref:Ionotropic glutamate receptor C-terminal domain-containing protein n=1 Tax=Orchesella dallaii TaxID=48710 RepID=A0ABP1QR82_9HEXA